MKRIIYLDTITGLLIIHMVWGHILRFANLVNTDLYHYSSLLFSFFMPWFFFKSGMFLHSDWLKTIQKSIKSLLIPFVKFSLIGVLVKIGIDSVMESDFTIDNCVVDNLRFFFWNGSFSGNQPLWFLLSLCFVRVLGSLILKLSLSISFSWQLLVLIGVCAFIMAFFLHGKICPLTIQNCSAGLFFFLMGYLFRNAQFKNRIGIASLLLYISICCIYPVVIDMRGNSVEFGSYVIWPFSSLTGIIAMNYVFKRIPVTCSCLSKIGEKSLFVYVWHWIPLIVTQFANNTILRIEEPIELLFIYTFACVSFLFILYYMKIILLSNKYVRV